MREETTALRKRRYFAGATVEQALVLAARHYGVDPSEIVFRRLEKRHGFVKTPRRVILEVDPASPLRSEVALSGGRSLTTIRSQGGSGTTISESVSGPPGIAERGGTHRQPHPPTVSISGDSALAERELLPEARRAISEILRFAGLGLVAEVRMEAGEVCVELTGRDRDLLLEDEAEVLLALEHLIPRCLGLHHRESLGCRVDSEGFRSRREAELRGMAEAAAETVRRTGQPAKLDPLSPAERRVVHLSLAALADVVTESEGDGHFKRVTIRPA